MLNFGPLYFINPRHVMYVQLYQSLAHEVPLIRLTFVDGSILEQRLDDLDKYNGFMGALCASIDSTIWGSEITMEGFDDDDDDYEEN